MVFVFVHFNEAVKVGIHLAPLAPDLRDRRELVGRVKLSSSVPFT